MPAPVVFDCAPLVVRDLAEVAQHVLDRRIRQRSALQRGVDLVHVSLMVLVVMEFHRRLVDVRLERVVGVGERWDGVGHGSPLSGFSFEVGR